jgi:cold shock CspA family protein
MTRVGAALRALAASNTRWQRTIAFYEMKDISPLPEAKLLEELAYFYDTVLETVERSANLVDIRRLGRCLCLAYEGITLTAALDAEAVHTRLESAWEKVPWSLGVGLAAGDCVAFEGPNGLSELAGTPLDRAEALARLASEGGILVAEDLAVALADEVSFGRPRKLGRGPSSFAYRSLTASAEDLDSHHRPETQRRTGTLVRWDSDQGRGLIITDDDERFYTDRRHLAIGSEPLEGARMLFLAEAPADGPDSNALAAAAVVLGDKLQGRVAIVDLAKGYAFVEVHDRAGFAQRLITARGVDVEALNKDATVEFFVEENARGGVAAQPRVLSATAYFGPEPAIAARFVAALTNQLRRHGASGAAAAALRAVSLDWVPTHTPVNQQQQEARALAKFALEHWALRGLRAIGEGTLALRLLQEGEMPLNPAESAHAMGTIREILKARPDYELGEANPITPRAVAKVLAEIQLALRALARTGEAGSLSELEAVAKVAEHLGYALSHAFRSGIVTSLPPETKEALAAAHGASA